MRKPITDAVAADWARGLDGQGYPASDVIRTYMASLRKSGAAPLRDWDRF